jgi:hypothetical protein
MGVQIRTDWVKPPIETGGLDHLGVQAPCIQIYSQLLPGITNVTDRARYYSFYLWLLNEFEKKSWRQKDELVQQLRKADCLFSLISIRHGQLNSSSAVHDGSAVGSNTLKPLLSRLEAGKSICLSDYTHFNDNDKTRYFKNPFGGLGQYYFGVLYELKLMAGASVNSATLIKQTGAKIANAMSLGVAGDAFMQVLESDEVTVTNLDALSSFCHCQLSHSEKEATLLIDVMREGWPAIADDAENSESVEGEVANTARARSLALFIKLAGVCATQGKKFDVDSFRGLIYSQYDLEQQMLEYSESLTPVAHHWQVYQRNEALAVAMQGLFFTMLRAADLHAGSINQRFMSTKALSLWFWHEGPGCQFIKNNNAETLSEALRARSDALPDFGDWRNVGHEVQLCERIVKQTNQTSLNSSDLEVITASCLDVLAAVCCRTENQGGYEQVQFRPGYLEPYPVNLNTVPEAINQSLSEWNLLDALVKFTAYYCLDSHLQVAMRKLRQQGKNTSRFEVTENGLMIKSIPSATHTSPRFYQAMGILRDLGLITANEEYLLPSDSGLAFLAAVS